MSEASDRNPELCEISVNRHITTASDKDVLASYDTHQVVHGGSYNTLIRPEYDLVYRAGVRFIMKGVIAEISKITPTADGDEIKSSVFGFTESYMADYQDQKTSMFVPCVDRHYVPMLDGKLTEALDGHHDFIITATNSMLVFLNSPYRLAPLDK